MSTKIFTTAVLAVFAATSAFADTYEITQWGEKIAPDSEIVNPFYNTGRDTAHNLGDDTYVIKIEGTTAENPFELKNADGSLSGTAFSGTLIIDGHYIGTRSGSGWSSAHLTIRDNSSFTINGRDNNNRFNFWTGSVNIGQSAKMASEKGMLFKSTPINSNGELAVTGTNLGESFAFMASNAVFNAGAKLSSVSGRGFTTYEVTQVASNRITVNAGVAESALAVTGEINLAGKTTVNFNASNAFSTNGNMQAKSTFTLVSYSFDGSAIIIPEKRAKADVVFNSTANNSFGQIQFWTDSTLTLNLDAKSFMAFGEFVMDSDASGSLCTVIVNNLSDSSKTFFISDKIYEAIDYGTVILKDSNGNELSYIATKASDEDFAMTGLDSELGGGYWLAVNSVVPEPATYAALFGLFALGFVLYRRRR